MSEIRLQKFMADCGVASRRACEDLIEDGHVKVNGKVIRTQGFKINPIKDQVEVEGKTITQLKSKTYIAFHKPRGILSTMFDPDGRPCLSGFFESFEERLFHVGRLDKESEGLIILTNDGQWAHHVSHPSFEVEKTYVVETREPLSKAALQRLATGVELEDGFARPLSARSRGIATEIVIHEGRNQIVRRMFEEIGFPVLRLTRTSIGPIKLGELPAGRWRSLNNVEVTSLYTEK